MSSSSPSSWDRTPGVEYLEGAEGYGQVRPLYFVSEIIIPAWPLMILEFVGKHHLSLIIEKWEEEVHIPIDNTCTVPACVTISCVLPRPI